MVMVMAKDKQETQRRVYVLPSELVDRIIAFQEEKRYPSEVEAVRRLLDEALLHRDTEATIIKRFQSRLHNLRMPSEVAKEVLVGHPLITDISFGRDSVTFTVKGFGKFMINENGIAKEYNSYAKEWQDWSEFGDDIPF